MKADIELAPPDAVEPIQPARSIMPLKDADLLSEMSQTDACGQTRHACTQDGDVIVAACVHKKGRANPAVA
jgi:hypothetical protein